ncbi:MAG: hypothetical protein ABW185_06320, partial [Sedimenticola sp.]
KNVYPYQFCDSFSKFNYASLPEKPAFYNNLTKKEISDADYQHAQTVWAQLNVQSFGEYHDIYLKTDVLLLADCFEKFRDICINTYKLDPAQFVTSPGLSWSAALKMTKCKLELITDPNMSSIQLYMEWFLSFST